MARQFEWHDFATQVQPQSGQLLVEHRGVELWECPRKIYRLNPRAVTQSLEGQTLHEDKEGYLYLAH